MKHRFRFYGSRRSESLWGLQEDEWHHILKVLRLNEGETIEIVDGLGWVAEAQLHSLSKNKGSFSIERETFHSRPPESDEVTIAVGVLKPQGIDEIIPGLVELGVSRLVFVPFHGMDKSRLSEKLLDRWQRQIVSASKQAKTPWFPQLLIEKSFDSFLQSSQAYHERILLDPEGEILDAAAGSIQGPVLAAIGSEAGWSESEVERLLTAGFGKRRIHSHILRATTATLATAAIVRQSLALRKTQ